MANRPNYCHLLGLNPLKEDKYNAAAIEKRIKECETKWSNDSNSKENDSQKRFKSGKLLEMVPDIRRIMSDPILKKKEFADGRKYLSAKGQKLKAECIIMPDGSMLAFKKNAENFVKQLYWKDVTADDIIKALGMSQDQPKPPVGTNVENAFKAVQAVECYTAVDVLNSLIQHPGLDIRATPLTDGSSPAQIKAAFDACEKRINSIRPGTLTSQDSYIQTLRAIKLVLDDKSLAELQMYGRCQEAMAPVMDTMAEEYSRQFTRKYIDDLVKAHISKGLDYDMCLKILEVFCYKKKLPANFSKAESTLSRCPHCAMMVEKGPNTLFCPLCGKKFSTMCPKCGTVQEATNSVCIGCGLNFKDAEAKASRYAMDFRQCMGKGKISAAARSLSLLKDASPGYNGMNAMERDLSVAQEDLRSRRKLIMDAYDKKTLCKAKTLSEDLMLKYPDAVGEDAELSQAYAESVAAFTMADQLCQRAIAEPNRASRTPYYVQAVEACKDHPVAMSKLRENPPLGPASPAVEIKDDCLVVDFADYAEPANTVYCIYRSKGSFPVVTDETRPLAEISADSKSYSDSSMEPGVEYYYRIFTKRYGVLSRDSAQAGPALVTPNVTNLSVDEIPGGFRIDFTKPRGACKVRLWRALDPAGADAIEIALGDETVYDDYVEGGRKYYYMVVTEYRIGNMADCSKAEIRCVEAHVRPKPVNDIRIRRDDRDGTYIAKWSRDQTAVLYHSPKKVPIDSIYLKMDDVNAWMKPVDVVELLPDGARFRLPDGAIEYVYPITQMGKLAIRGRGTSVSNAKPFSDLDYAITGKDCVITMAWPEGAKAAKIIVSNDRTKSIDDATAEVVIVKREQYMKDKQIRIGMGQHSMRCFNAYAIYDVDGIEINSKGISFEAYSGIAKKVRYTVKQERSGIRLGFQTDKDVKAIPPVVAVVATTGIPLKQRDGERVYESNGTIKLIDGKGELSIACSKIDIARMRLFFADDRDYNMFKLIHPLYGRRD